VTIYQSAVRAALCLLCLCGLSGCMAIAVTSAVVGTAAAVAVEVVEVPFEVAGAVYDAATDEEDNEDEDSADQR
jgi:hypothetical protein